jgi:hypothetical protein
MESKKVLHTTVISDVIVIILCFALTNMGTVREQCCVQAMSTALIAGKSYWNQSFDGTKTKKYGSTFEVMLPGYCQELCMRNF